MEKYYRKPTSKIIDTYQAIEWQICDNDDECVVYSFGSTDNSESVCCMISGYHPFFYIKVPKTWKMANLLLYIDKILKEKINAKNAISYYQRDALIRSEIVLENKMDYYGFSNKEEHKFAKLVFKSHAGMKAYLYGIKKLNKLGNIEKYPLYNTNIDALLTFFHLRNIEPSNWIKIVEPKLQESENSTCQINIQCDISQISGLKIDRNVPFLQASFDIETYSCPKVKNEKEYYPFPVPEIPENVIYQIATCFKKLGSEKFMVKHLLTLKKCSKIEVDEDNVEIVVCECDSEEDLLLKWKSLIELMDPDILYQYNGDMFDCNYMYTRANNLGILDKFLETSRLLDTPSSLKDSSFSSSAYGTSNYKRLVIPGRINFDILIFMKREYKENSYKLKNISSKYLGDTKDDIDVIEIFKAYESGDSDQIARIAHYCVVDTLLPQRLVDTLYILIRQISMSNVSLVPIKYLIERGQSVKALSLISNACTKMNYLMPHFEYNDSTSYVGATVLSPIVGITEIVTVLDFASLYPSIIMAHNLCFTTIVLDKKYLGLEGVEYLEVELDKGKVYFAKNTESIVQSLLQELAVQRAKYKGLMKSSEGALYNIYDVTQQAYKVTMNSMYGIMGSNGMGIKNIAAAVTKIGRDMIEESKNFIENNHHDVYPKGHTSNKLDENDIVTIKIGEQVKNIKVKHIENTIKDNSNVYIETVKGWRKFKRVKSV